jgi:hypothetical protein
VKPNASAAPLITNGVAWNGLAEERKKMGVSGSPATATVAVEPSTMATAP